jgi:hypothetical protein
MNDERTHVGERDPEIPPTNPTPTNRAVGDGQMAGHWVLSEEDRTKGYVRPVRVSYRHNVCGVVTMMPLACAQTYAVNPRYYGSTWCCGCRAYLPVGEHGEFVWDGTAEKVGT